MIRSACLVFAALMLVSCPARAALSWQKAVYHYAKIYKINPCVVFAIIETESSGNPNAVTVNYRRGYRSYRSRRSADHLVKSRYRNMDIGLMQINQYWIDQKLKISKTKLLDPLYNIDIGEWLINGLLVKCKGSYRCAVAQYHSSNYYRGKRYLNKVIEAYYRNRWNCKESNHQANTLGGQKLKIAGIAQIIFNAISITK